MLKQLLFLSVISSVAIAHTGAQTTTDTLNTHEAGDTSLTKKNHDLQPVGCACTESQL